MESERSELLQEDSPILKEIEKPKIYTVSDGLTNKEAVLKIMKELRDLIQ
jgi:hypothetical protein